MIAILSEKIKLLQYRRCSKKNFTAVIARSPTQLATMAIPAPYFKKTTAYSRE